MRLDIFPTWLGKCISGVKKKSGTRGLKPLKFTKLQESVSFVLSIIFAALLLSTVVELHALPVRCTMYDIPFFGFLALPYARFTLDDPMPRLASDVVGGKSGRNHPHWPNGAQCVHSRRLVPGSRTILYDSLVGTVKESYLLQLTVALYTFGSRSADDLPIVSR